MGWPFNVDFSMRCGILIVVSHFVSLVRFCDPLPGGEEGGEDAETGRRGDTESLSTGAPVGGEANADGTGDVLMFTALKSI